MNLLIYDSIISNHLLEYFEHIIKYLKGINKYSKVFIIVPPSFFDLYTENVQYISWKALEKQGIIFLPFPENIKRFSHTSKSNFAHSHLELRFINDFCYEKNIKDVILLNLDYFQLALGVRSFLFWRKRLKFSGILFSSFYDIPRFTSRRFRKIIQLTLMIKNYEVKKVFVLNDYELVTHMNSLVFRKVFSYLPDPISESRFVKTKNFREVNGIKDTDFLLLSLGRMSQRKNVHNILRALDLMSNELLANLKFVACGTFDEDIYRRELQLLLTERIKNNVIFVDYFLTNSEFESIINEADCVSTVYIDFYGSSGILGNAAKCNKLVLASEKGTISRIVRNYKLGVCADPLSPISICNSISKLVKEKDDLIDIGLFSNFCQTHLPVMFTAHLFATDEY